MLFPIVHCTPPYFGHNWRKKGRDASRMGELGMGRGQKYGKLRAKTATWMKRFLEKIISENFLVNKVIKDEGNMCQEVLF